MQQAMDSLDEKCAQRRREKMAIFEGRPIPLISKVIVQPESLYSRSSAPSVNHHGAKTIFLTSLSGNIEEEAPTGESDSETAPAHQKNRPGQRARQARHKLNEAKKAKKMGVTVRNVEGMTLPLQSQPADTLKDDVTAGNSHEWKGGHNTHTKRRLGADLPERPLKRPTPNAIHASWEAAKIRREKEASLMFVPSAGTKTVFDDERSPQDSVSISQTGSKLGNISKPPEPEKRIAAEIVHPSWIAKQAQKDKASAGFQGKKIVFD
jgi:hypothetical protein